MDCQNRRAEGLSISDVWQGQQLAVIQSFYIIFNVENELDGLLIFAPPQYCAFLEAASMSLSLTEAFCS